MYVFIGSLLVIIAVILWITGGNFIGVAFIFIVALLNFIKSLKK